MSVHEVSRVLIRIGIFLVIAGIIIKILPNFKFAPLPGDITIEKKNFTFYFPIVTCIVISIALTVIVNLFFRK